MFAGIALINCASPDEASEPGDVEKQKAGANSVAKSEVAAAKSEVAAPKPEPAAVKIEVADPDGEAKTIKTEVKRTSSAAKENE